jgi:hypothetical protein
MYVLTTCPRQVVTKSAGTWLDSNFQRQDQIGHGPMYCNIPSARQLACRHLPVPCSTMRDVVSTASNVRRPCR